MSGAIGVFIPHLGCPHLCTFCNQNTISGTALPTPPCDIAKIPPPKVPHETELAFFGGSFTAIDKELMVDYLKAGQAYVKAHGLKGIRLSTRPDCIDEGIIKILIEHGVTTIELGAQSMDDAVLANCERGHKASDVERASQLINKTGISLVLQMMTGLKGDSPQGAILTAKKLAALRPSGVRIYPTLVLKGSELERDKDYAPQTLEQAIDLAAKLTVFFEKEGIDIIKMGIHAESSYDMGELVAGPYHPSFRELVHAKIYRDKALPILSGMSGDIELVCAKGRVSQVVGQKRSNKAEFLALPKIKSITFTEDDKLYGFELVARQKM